MKKIASFLLLLFGAGFARAAQTYTIVDARFIHDVDQGTFVVGSSTYGAISAFQYRVTLADSVTAKSCTADNTLTMNPRLSFPSANAIKNAVQQAVTDQEMKRALQKCLAEKNSPNAITSSNVADNVAGVVGATVTPP